MFDDEMLTIEDVAAYLKLKPQTIYKWAQTGKIPGAKFGKEWRFRRSAIEQWIDRQISSQTDSSRVGAAATQLAGEGNNDDGSRVKLTARDSEKVESSASKSKASRISKGRLGPEKN